MSDQVTEQAGSDFAVVDTMIASAIIVGTRSTKTADLLNRYERYLRGVSPVISFATVAELRYGALKAKWGPGRVQPMEDWIHKAAVVLPDNDLVDVCANLRNECEKRGHGLKDQKHDSDRWIAATAIRYNIPLISDDRIFNGVPGLRLLQV